MTGLAPVRLVPSSFCLAISRAKSTQSVIDVAKVVCYIDYIRIILSMYQTTDLVQGNSNTKPPLFPRRI